MRLAAWSAAIWTVAMALALGSQAVGQVNNPPGAARPQDRRSRSPQAAKDQGGQESPGQSCKEETPAVPPPPATAAQKAAISTLPVAERLAIQSDLVWSGDLTGAASIRNSATGRLRPCGAFQKPQQVPRRTGIITPEQLADARRRDAHPQGLYRLAPGGGRCNAGRAARHSRRNSFRRSRPGKPAPAGSSARGEIQIETFREKMAGRDALPTCSRTDRRRPAGRRTVTSSLARQALSPISGHAGPEAVSCPRLPEGQRGARHHHPLRPGHGRHHAADGRYHHQFFHAVRRCRNSASASRKVQYGSGYRGLAIRATSSPSVS